ncbi:Arv1-domain-containing protein, partial [Clavulina sp. PMI_390]
MPLCTACTSPIEYLYTVYSKHNIRLEQCSQCQAFADPYVEHDWLNIMLDLILLKPAVYRHLLFNRGAPPRSIASQDKTQENVRTREIADAASPELARWATTLKLGLPLVLFDAYIR